MNDSKISARYAKALFNFATENGKIEEIKKDIDLLYETCKIVEFNTFLNSPILQTSKKITVLQNTFTGKIQQAVLDFIIIMTKNRREPFLKIITLNFLQLYRKHHNITESEITTAVSISAQNKQKLQNLLQQHFKGTITIKNTIVPDIIGGFILKINDKQLDASIKGQLNTYKQQLTKTTH